MKLSKVQKGRAIEQMHDLMLRQPQGADGMNQCCLEAVAVLESYFAAAEARTADLPSRQLLGEACFCLISSVGLFRDDDNIQFISELLTPEFGIELYGLLPRVNRLLDEAVEKGLELVEIEAKAKAAEPATDFDLF